MEMIKLIQMIKKGKMPDYRFDKVNKGNLKK